MDEQDATSGPIIIWFNYGTEGWKPQSFDTIKEALGLHVMEMNL